MRNIFFVLISFFIFIGCSSNTKNLTFDSTKQNAKEFRVTFQCSIPFDDVRKVKSLEYKGTTKDIYYVEFNNIYESLFEVTQTYATDAEFSLDTYVDYLKEQDAIIFHQEKNEGILYIIYSIKGKRLNQMVTASNNALHIINAEPMMFNAIRDHCKNR